MATGAKKEADRVPANFGMKDEFRPDLGGGGAAGSNSSAVQSRPHPTRNFPGNAASKTRSGRHKKM